MLNVTPEIAKKMWDLMPRAEKAVLNEKYPGMAEKVWVSSALNAGTLTESGKKLYKKAAKVLGN